MYMHFHVSLHLCVRCLAHTHIHTYVRYIHTYMSQLPPPTCKYMYTYIHTYIYLTSSICITAFVGAFVSTCIHTYIHTHTHTYIRISHIFDLHNILCRPEHLSPHAYIHTHTHTYIRISHILNLHNVRAFVSICMHAYIHT